MHLLTSLLPTVAVFLCAKPIQGILNIFYCLFLGADNYPLPGCSLQSLGG